MYRKLTLIFSLDIQLVIYAFLSSLVQYTGNMEYILEEDNLRGP